MNKLFHKHFKFGCLIIDIDLLGNKFDITITLTSSNWR